MARSGKRGSAGKRHQQGTIEMLESRRLLSTYVTLSGPSGGSGPGGAPREGDTLSYTVNYFAYDPLAAGGTVNICYSGTATPGGVDYDNPTTSLNIPANPYYWPSGGLFAFTVPVKQDNLIEGPESLIVTLTTDSPNIQLRPYGFPSNMDATPYFQSTATIADDPPIVNISHGRDGAEGGNSVQFQITRTGGLLTSTIPVSVAVDGASYSVAVGSLAILDVPVPDDPTPEWTQTVTAQIQPGPYLIGIGTATALVADNDLTIGQLPSVLPANNDDDNSNGIPDIAESTASASDDDVQTIDLGFPTEFRLGATVSLGVTGPLKLYYTDGTPLALGSNGWITWTLGSGEAPPHEILVAASGGMTTVNGAAITLVDDDHVLTHNITTTQTTPVALDIQYSGATTTGQLAADVVIGQWIPVSASVIAPAGWVQGLPQWSVSGTCYQAFNIALDQSTSTLVPFEGSWTQAWGTGFYWADASSFLFPNPYNETVSASVSLCGANLTRTVEFVVEKPTSTFSADMGAVTVAAGDLYLSGAAAGDGIYFTADVNMPQGFSPSGGEYTLVQMVKVSRYYAVGLDIYGAAANGEWGLDTVFPYPKNPPTWTTGTGPQTTNDQVEATNRPFLEDGEQINVSYFEVDNEQFRMLLLFRPKGDGAQWVPLRELDYAWSGQAAYARLNPNLPPSWQLSGASSTSPVHIDSDTTTDYPIWARRTAQDDGLELVLC